ncbi:type I-E CRISPR-associated protein Cas5/CasD [Streptomyces adustus]|uniref:Type I-E CRISPR-associated protein Cas5/CasD n=1 Tax=Streptomyces adustus TaxID=1609272 RepID=A0A5N8VUG2_9ACTN|nr:type I-E CRISPR-associated protein Cas5/CasD [Streptomyces adustus]MPY38326.1 type I-E CRISPR-associated protein Cas5/CasD [Streptomyces adustus]
MPTLLMCFDAPMQSWGVRSQFNSRDTATEPTKSGVVGLLAAALGIPQDADEDIRHLATLRMGVRVDREGVVENDFHTVQNVPNTEGKNHRTAVTKRFYMADALFLVALESDDTPLLDRLRNALDRPHWPLYFGRKAFVPARPIASHGLPGERQPITHRPLDEALTLHPWLENQPHIRARHRPIPDEPAEMWLRTIIDADPMALDVELRHDHPLSFRPQQRLFASRAVQTIHVPLTPAMISDDAA